ncbi:hypothetical protein BDY21DRAFT_354433 [Lineolata rhizophorae]|uniref:Uncharacterized protein n=1 Tax=Lineolata rhizophorae TaxID=578093 RepID=A0A6A6NQ73_9PEZI|nr:hypothetical protein BDY21DRAFT_354433 [Lineolata rhizophorae]
MVNKGAADEGTQQVGSGRCEGRRTIWAGPPCVCRIRLPNRAAAAAERLQLPRGSSLAATNAHALVGTRRVGRTWRKSEVGKCA